MSPPADHPTPTAVVETIESVEHELGRWTGKSVPRTEDRRLLKGQGQFVDDAWMHRQGYVHFLRSPYAHANIRSIDTSRAAALPGVLAVADGVAWRRPRGQQACGRTG